MARTFPPDVIVLDLDSFVHARLAAGKKEPQIVQAKSFRLPAGTFVPGLVTPELANEAALADGLRRMKMETGKWDKVSILLPDAWFRMNLLELPSLPEKQGEAAEVVRWSLKRTLPIDPAELRVAYEVLHKAHGSVKLLVVSVLEKTLAAIERVFAEAGLEVVLVEPVGLNIWNAIAVREAATARDRLFLYVRDTDFTTAVFRGPQPLFIRSRNLNAERTLQQEIRLSASYLRDTLQATGFETCYIAGNRVDRDLEQAVAEEFAAPVRSIGVQDFVEGALPESSGFDAELTACTGVFTG
jgi:type IV pilus assembly protein PilM